MKTRLAVASAAVVLALLLCGSVAQAQSVRTGRLALNTTIAQRSSVRISTSVLQFEVVEGGVAAEAVVSYRVAVRTRPDGGVRLTVEPARTLEAGDGRVTAGLAVVCGADAVAPALAVGTPQPVARWRDSGMREGRLRCRLEGTALPGRYSLPVKFAVVLE